MLFKCATRGCRLNDIEDSGIYRERDEKLVLKSELHLAITDTHWNLLFLLYKPKISFLIELSDLVCVCICFFLWIMPTSIVMTVEFIFGLVYSTDWTSFSNTSTLHTQPSLVSTYRLKNVEYLFLLAWKQCCFDHHSKNSNLQKQ